MHRVLIFVLFALSAFGQNTARFPTAVATLQDLAFAKDSPNRSILNGAISNSIVTVPVLDGSVFADFNIVTFSDTGEQAMICSISGNTLTLCGRGFSGTTADSHLSGIGVLGNMTAWHHNQLASEIIAMQAALGANMANVSANVSWGTLTGKPIIPSLTSQLTNDSGFLTNTPAQTWASITGKPTAVSAWTNDSGYLTSVPAQTWASITGKPTAISTWTNDSGYQTASGTVANAGNATTLGGLAMSTGVNNAANQIVRTDGNAYLNAGYINTISNDNSTTAIARVYASNDAFLRYYTMANFAKQSENALPHDASWSWQDNYIALPTGVVQWGVFGASAAQDVITSVRCSSDTGDAVIQLRRSDGVDIITGNMGCGTGAAGTYSTSINGYGTIPVSWFVGMWAVSGTAKRINVTITYTTAY